MRSLFLSILLLLPACFPADLAAQSGVDIETGLVAHYPFGGSLAEVVGGRDGEPLGSISYARGPTGGPQGAIVLTGRNGIRLPVKVFAGLQSFSVAFWYQPSPQQLQRFSTLIYASSRQGNSPSMQWRDRSFAAFAIPGGLHVVSAFADSTSQTVCLHGDLGLLPGQWHHLVLAFDAARSTMDVSVDGRGAIHCRIEGTAPRFVYQTIQIGQPVNPQQADAGAYRGDFGPLRVYNRPITAVEAAELFRRRS